MNMIEVGPAHSDVLAQLHAEGFDAPWTSQSFVQSLSSPGTFALVAQNKEAHPLGFVLIRSGGGEAEILTLVTRPQFRRQGVAKALMAEGVENLKKSSAQKLFLEVATDNPNAAAFYVTLGFTEVGRRKAYYQRAHGACADAVLMALSLL